MQVLVAAVTVFVLAVFIGFEIITKVPPTLHTPLMSGSNAISGVALIGAVISTRTDNPKLATILGTAAVAFAMVNVVGGYMVTHRMLAMFQNKR
jgi:NAD(P) transhydrogenase subunit alpha